MTWLPSRYSFPPITRAGLYRKTEKGGESRSGTVYVPGRDIQTGNFIDPKIGTHYDDFVTIYLEPKRPFMAIYATMDAPGIFRW